METGCEPGKPCLNRLNSFDEERFRCHLLIPFAHSLNLQLKIGHRWVDTNRNHTWKTHSKLWIGILQKKTVHVCEQTKQRFAY